MTDEIPKRIPMCWKCDSSIIEPNYDGKGYNLKGCKEEETIHNYRDAEKLCPVVKEAMEKQNESSKDAEEIRRLKLVIDDLLENLKEVVGSFNELGAG